MSDLFTKYAVTVALQDMTAATVANAIIDEWIMKFGAPDVIHTDQGSNFNSELMHDICRIFMIEKTRTTPYHPQGNGQVERFNRIIPDTFSKNVLNNRRSGMCICLILLLCITPLFTDLSERRRSPSFSGGKRNTP